MKSFQSPVREKLVEMALFDKEATLASQDRHAVRKGWRLFISQTHRAHLPFIFPHLGCQQQTFIIGRKKEITLSIAFTMINVRHNHRRVQFHKGNKCRSLWIIENHNVSSSVGK